TVRERIRIYVVKEWLLFTLSQEQWAAVPPPFTTPMSNCICSFQYYRAALRRRAETSNRASTMMSTTRRIAGTPMTPMTLGPAPRPEIARRVAHSNTATPMTEASAPGRTTSRTDSMRASWCRDLREAPREASTSYDLAWLSFATTRLDTISVKPSSTGAAMSKAASDTPDPPELDTTFPSGICSTQDSAEM